MPYQQIKTKYFPLPFSLNSVLEAYKQSLITIKWLTLQIEYCIQTTYTRFSLSALRMSAQVENLETKYITNNFRRASIITSQENKIHNSILERI